MAQDGKDCIKFCTTLLTWMFKDYITKDELEQMARWQATSS